MKSHRQFFRSSATIGSASVISMAIGIAKVKVLAVLLGPAGIGLMGLYQNIMNMAATLAGCGIGTSGVRQLAASSDDSMTLSIIRRSLFLGGLALGIGGLAVLYLLREPVAHWVFGDGEHTAEVGWLGVGLLLSLVAGSQTSILRGLRRVSDMARVTILSAVISALLGILVVKQLGEAGVIWFVLIAPGANFLVATVYTARLQRSRLPYDFTAIQRQWLGLLKLGIPLMTAGLITLVTQLAVRSVVLQELGLEASGYFQAAWAISFTYVGLILNAMTMDYFPRLTKTIDDHVQSNALVNEQSEMALLLLGPVLLAMMTLAPSVVHVLYAPEFRPAAEILRWQVLGDIMKVVSAPIVFVFMSKGRGEISIAVQIAWSAAYLLTVVFGIGRYGLVTAGMGFWIAYLIYFGVVAITAYKIVGFKPTKRNALLIVFLVLVSAAVMLISRQSVLASYVFGLGACALLTVYSFRRLNQLIDLTGWLRNKFL